MMPINKALVILHKMLACRTELYCNIYCSDCPYEASQSEKVAALEAAIEHIKREDGEKHEQNI